MRQMCYQWFCDLCGNFIGFAGKNPEDNRSIKHLMKSNGKEIDACPKCYNEKKVGK